MSLMDKSATTWSFENICRGAAAEHMVHKFLAMISIALTVLLSCFLVVASVSAAQSGDQDRGKTTFEKRCTGCHSLDMEKEGPRLRGVFGRKAGTVASFK